MIAFGRLAFLILTSLANACGCFVWLMAATVWPEQSQLKQERLNLEN
jgi:hypothetical protein